MGSPGRLPFFEHLTSLTESMRINLICRPNVLWCISTEGQQNFDQMSPVRDQGWLPQFLPYPVPNGEGN